MDKKQIEQFVEWTDIEHTSGLPNIPLDYEFSTPEEIEMWVERIKTIHEWFKSLLGT